MSLSAEAKALVDLYGQPVHAEAPEEHFALRYSCREPAEAFLEMHNQLGNEEPSWVEERDGQWIRVIDMRATMARLRVKREGTSGDC